ncbi:hypothetical protein KC363_g7781 [Hortaea werneckii]|uniref:DUF6697 domain-containing protein n=1 Tax=Hortaea werneckii TaxID=91943 RepID=A0A3M7F5H9_HORWE|nr:hypothetical protein KC363_g7781 [Hortaea werneckii]RMY84013.1 hypothetical protein D0861_07152 [Hortaea werneckii]
MSQPFNQQAPHGGFSNNIVLPITTYKHPNRRHHQQSHPQNPMQHWSGHSNGLNPRTPGFVPTGKEIQPLYPSSPYPSTTTNSYQLSSTNSNNPPNFFPSPVPDPTTFSDFQNYIYRQHIHHLTGISQLQTASRETDEAVAETREVVKKDLGTLYRLLQQQQKRIDELYLSPPTAAAAAAAPDDDEGEVEQQTLQAVVQQRVHGGAGEPGIWDLEVVEPGVMLERFDARVVAELYEEQAGKMEEVVRRLRGFAAQARIAVDGAELGNEAGEVGNGDDFSLVVDGSGVASRDFAGGNQGKIAGSLEGQTKLVADDDEVESTIQDRRPGTSNESTRLVKTERADIFVEQNNTTIQPSTTKPWIPCALRNLPPTNPPLLPDPAQTFTWEFLFNTLSGVQWSPGFYFNPSRSSPSASNLPATKSYWLLDTPFEPFLPSQPGHPGAKITAFFNDTLPTSAEEAGESAAPTEEDYLNTPIFISPDPLDTPSDERRYTYFGHYSQKRFSDRIGYDTLRDNIPKGVLRFWAECLASPERPEWISRQLMRVFWPRPGYEGPVFSEEKGMGSSGSSESGDDGAVDERVLRDLREYARELAEWEREARKKVGLLKPEDLLESFEMSDAAAQPGLRLWWEYFEFVEFDREFYDGLVDAQEKSEEVKKEAAVKAKKKEAGARKAKVEQIHPMPAYVKEDARMEKEGHPSHNLATNSFSAQNGGPDSEQTPNPLTMKYQHPYFPDTNEQPSPPPTPLAKAGPKTPPSRPGTTKPKSPLPSNDWSNVPQPTHLTESTRTTNSNSMNTSWSPSTSGPSKLEILKQQPHPQPERTTNGVPAQSKAREKSTTTGDYVNSASGFVEKGAGKLSPLPNGKALEEARRFQQNATKARERRGGGGGGRGGPPHLRR